MPNPLQTLQDELQRMTDERHAWLKPAAEQVKRWREEDERNGIKWGLKDGGKA